ncbi:MAG: metallophosphoesterase [Prevotella sp.]|jgi:predicted phosphodiesterase|nr:metallophosphoesterase [Prevotella sp.]
MKKYKIQFIVSVALLTLTALPVQAQQYFVSSVAAKGASYLNVQENVLSFANTADSKTVTLSTNLAFALGTVPDSWCSPVLQANAVQVQVEANTQSAARTTPFTLVAKDNKSVEITVQQLGTSPSVLVREQSVYLEDDKRAFTLEVTANVVPEFELPTWITPVNVTPAVGIQTYAFEASALAVESTRTGNIVVKGAGAASVTVPVSQKFNGYVTFAVISDTHLGNSQGEGPLVKVPKALKNITSHKPLDAIFVVGDLTDSGSASQYTQFVNVFANAANYTNPVGRMVYMLGNHDNYSAQQNYVEGLRPLNNGDDYPFDQYMVIKGYPFITISQRGSHNTDAATESNGPASYPKAVQDTLENWLARAAAECPGKPIFVFTHVPLKYTCYSSWPGEGDGTSWPTWSMKVLNPILNKYPQAVVFGGHSHFPIGDPRSIHQGVNPNSDKKNFFTAINTGSTTYSEIHRPSVDIGIHPENYAYVTEGYILTAQPDGDVEIQRWDTYRNEEMHPESRWILKAPHDGSAFQYADTRDLADVPAGFTNPVRDGLPAPSFGASDVPTVSAIGINSCTVTFPQATDNDYVFRYLVQIKKENGTVVKEYRKFSQFYLNSAMPATLSVTLDGLTANTVYTAEVTAYDSYDNTSSPIASAQFTTLVDNDPANQPPTPQGQWLFDDAGDLLKATIGLDLVPVVDNSGVNQAETDIATAGIVAVTGPSASNGAVTVPKAYGLRLDHGSSTAVTTYTLMYDIKVPLTESYYSLLYTHNNAGDGDIFIKKEGSVGLSVTGWGYSSAGVIKAGQWHRVVVVVTDRKPKVYVDGSLARAEATTAYDRWALQAHSTWLFSDNTTEDGTIEVAGLSYWNTALTDAQISNLGNVQ